VLTSGRPLKIKRVAVAHRTANLAYILMGVLAILRPLATLVRINQGLYETLVLDLPVFVGATISLCAFYWVSQREIGRTRWQTLRLIPSVLAIGIGICINNAKAVSEALVGYETPFVRTPKYGVEQAGESWTKKVYIKKSTFITLIELGLGLWFTYAIIFVLWSPKGSAFSIPFLMLFQFGFLYVGLLSTMQRFNVLRRT